MTQDAKDSDYVTIPKKPKECQQKGIKCGECGMKFDWGKAYSFSCQNDDCPIQTKIIM